MKKWSISLLVVALGIAAFAALPSMSSAAAGGPYCPGPYQPYKPCEESPKEPPPKEETKKCPKGQVGSYPDCVTPAVAFEGIKFNPNGSTLLLEVNAPGTVKVSGKGIKTTVVKVAAGKVKVKVLLTPKEKLLLAKKGELHLKVTITYTPTGGRPITKTVKITVKSPDTHHHDHGGGHGHHH
jgi:hypothetical protein